MAKIFIIPNEEEQEVIFTAPLNISIINLGDGLTAVLDPDPDIGVVLSPSGIQAIISLDTYEISLNAESYEIECVVATGVDLEVQACPT